MAETVVGHAGRYDDQAIRVFKETAADAVVVFVLNGKRGHGFSCSVKPELNARFSAELPALLRSMADGIEAAPGPDGIRFTSDG